MVVLQVRPGTMSGEGVGVLSASDPIRKVGALHVFGIGPTLFKYVFTRYNFGRGA